jgi:hypothetical protein
MPIYQSKGACGAAQHHGADVGVEPLSANTEVCRAVRYLPRWRCQLGLAAAVQVFSSPWCVILQVGISRAVIGLCCCWGASEVLAFNGHGLMSLGSRSDTHTNGGCAFSRHRHCFPHLPRSLVTMRRAVLKAVAQQGLGALPKNPWLYHLPAGL